MSSVCCDVLSSTHRLRGFMRMSSFSCSTMGVYSCIQSFRSGVYLCGGTGMRRISTLPPDASCALSAGNSGAAIVALPSALRRRLPPWCTSSSSISSSETGSGALVDDDAMAGA
eukprot:scaffold909_cov121-Isochrysis_galbana.AAC.2